MRWSEHMLSGSQKAIDPEVVAAKRKELWELDRQLAEQERQAGREEVKRWLKANIGHWFEVKGEFSLDYDGYSYAGIHFIAQLVDANANGGVMKWSNGVITNKIKVKYRIAPSLIPKRGNFKAVDWKKWRSQYED